MRRSSFPLVLTPEPNWDVPVWRCGGLAGSLPPVSLYQLPCPSFGLPACPADPTAALTESGPVTLTLGADLQTPGRYATVVGLFLPTGTSGFSIRACLGPEDLTSVIEGVTRTDSIWDCDTLHPLG